VINIIIWIRDTGCYTILASCCSVKREIKKIVEVKRRKMKRNEKIGKRKKKGKEKGKKEKVGKIGKIKNLFFRNCDS
jgi:hypothetical protein